LNHSTSPIFMKGFFKIGSRGTICLGWLQNRDSPDLCLLSS
jgi:hypothetical protein